MMERKNRKLNKHISMSRAVAGYEMKQWKTDCRVWAVFAVIALIVIKEAAWITMIGLRQHTRSTPWMVTLLFTEGTIATGMIKIIVYFGAIVLFCNAPFFNEITPYLLLRVKRKCWVVGEITYIFLASAVYAAVLVVVSVLFLLPQASLSQIWGSTIYYLCGNGWCGVPYGVVRKIYPETALCYTMLTAWLSFAGLGLLIFLLNAARKSQVLGVIAASGIVLLDPVVCWFASFGRSYQWLLMISPVNWSSIQNLRIVSGMGNLTVEYVLTAQVAILVVLISMILLSTKRIEIKLVRG